MYFDESMIARRVPGWIVERTRENMDVYCMSLNDSFEEAVKSYPKLKKGSELWKAWYYDDFRKYIPDAYLPEYLNFRKYPLKYSARREAV